MKTIELSKLDNLIKEYSNQKSFSKPLMLWFASNRTLNHVKADLTRNEDEPTKTRNIFLFWRKSEGSIQKMRNISIMGHPLDGHKRILIGDTVENIAKHPELLTNDVLPIGYTKDTKRIVYHTYEKQLRRDNLDYCCYQVRKLQIPIICLINDYEAAKEDTFNQDYLASNFDQFFVLERTVDEWIEWGCQAEVIKNQQGEEFNVPKIVPELVEYVRPHKDLFIESPALDGMPQEAVHTREARLNDISCAMRHAAWKPDFHHFFTKIEMEDSSQNFPFPKEYFYFTKREDFRQMLKDYYGKFGNGKEIK
ncbi:MAG: hypothetical protein ACI4AI_01155 [Paludibacteraceae bacterium]